MNLREKLAALRSRRANNNSALPAEIAPAPTLATSTSPRQARSFSVAARRQWQHEQLKNAARKARQNVIETGLYDVITREPPPEEVKPIAPPQRSDDTQEEPERFDDNASQAPELDEEQMERDEEERALQNAKRRLFMDDNNTNNNSRLTADEHQEHARSQHSQDEQQPASERNDSVPKSRDADLLTDGTHSRLKSATEPSASNNEEQSVHLKHRPDASGEVDNNATTSKESAGVQPGRSDEPLERNAGKNEKRSSSTVQDTSPESPIPSPTPRTPSPQKAPRQHAKNRKATRIRLYDVAPPVNPLGMVDDEADEEAIDQDERGQHEDHHESHLPESDGEDDDGIDDEQVTPKSCDKAKLANFHRQWELEKEKADVANAAAGGVVDDVDEAVDLTDLLRKEEQVEQENESDDSGSVSGAMAVGQVEEQHKRQSEDYIKQMFLRDDSKSRVLNDLEEDAENGQKREKARLLWKARQKAKAIRQRQDNDSLSRFDFLDKGAVTCSADIRHRLENACRRASAQPRGDETGKKRKASWLKDSSTLSNWEKRRKSLQEVAAKKRKGVAVSNWSFASHGKAEKAPTKPVRTSTPSLGASFVHSKSRSRHTPINNAGRQAASAPPRPVPGHNRRGPTSFKGLLTLLGKPAETAK